MKVKALAQWYGSNRMQAHRVGQELAGCEWVGIPFAGGMCEIPHIKARTIVANDLHKGIYCLAEAVACNCAALQDELRSRLFHPATLEKAQNRFFYTAGEGYVFDMPDRAADYFVIAWMTRSGTAGTDAERTGKLCLRWEAGGGDSAKRYHSAIDSLSDWATEFERCTFSCLDVFKFLDKCKDRKKHGLYLDPPFFGPGQKYSHKPDLDNEVSWHRKLRNHLEEFDSCRIVVRAYDCDFVREQYREESGWNFVTFPGRKQTNDEAPEVLIINGPSYGHNEKRVMK